MLIPLELFSFVSLEKAFGFDTRVDKMLLLQKKRKA